MEWIDANLEKPPHEVEVLAYGVQTLDGKNYYYYYLCEWWANEEEFHETEEWRTIKPDYWMYLPKPV